jgi:hypothetical protein
MFRPIVQEWLNIEKNCHWKFSKIKTRNVKDILGLALVLLEILWWIGFYGGDFVVFGPKVHEILNFEYFCHWKFHKYQKLKIWWNLNFKFSQKRVYRLPFQNSFNITICSTTQSTLVLLNETKCVMSIIVWIHNFNLNFSKSISLERYKLHQ